MMLRTRPWFSRCKLAGLLLTGLLATGGLALSVRSLAPAAPPPPPEQIVVRKVATPGPAATRKRVRRVAGPLLRHRG